MAVDVVVTNYHTEDLLNNFIASYILHAFDGCTLTVVDVETSRLVSHPHADLSLFFQDNVGYGKACNVGASYGTNEVILLANADTVLNEGLRECYNALLAFENWGVLGPRQVNEHNHLTAGGIIGTDRAPRQRGWNEVDNGQCSDILEDAISISGSLYFIKRGLWRDLTACPLFQQAQPESVGAFLETPHYYEDMFCSLHARAHGYKVVYYGPVKMTHYWHRSTPVGGWSEQQMTKSLAIHRNACDIHGIVHE